MEGACRGGFWTRPVLGALGVEVGDSSTCSESRAPNTAQFRLRPSPLSARPGGVPAYEGIRRGVPPEVPEFGVRETESTIVAGALRAAVPGS